MAAIDVLFTQLIDLGLPQVLAFLITFAIILGILTKSKLFGTAGTDKRADGINIVVSIAVSTLVLISPIGGMVSLWFTQFFVHLLVGLVLLLGIFVYMGFIGHDFDSDKLANSSYAKYIYGGVAAFVLFIFLNGSGFDLFGLRTGVGPAPFINIPAEAVNQLLAVGIILAVLGGSMYALLKSDTEAKPKKPVG